MDISRGHTFASDGVLSADNLNDLVGKSKVKNIVQADLDSSLHFALMTAPGSPSDDDFYLESDGDLRVYGSSRWNSPVPEDIVMVNGTGVTLATGSICVPDPTTAGQVIFTQVVGASEYDTKAIGAAQEQINPGATGFFRYKGIGHVLLIPSVSVDRSPGDSVMGPTSLSTGAGISLLATQAQSVPYGAAHLGVILETVSADVSQTPVAKLTMIRK